MDGMETGAQARNELQQNFAEVTEVINNVISSLKQVIKGRDDTIQLVVAALLGDGHVLLEDYPGSGKTTLTKTLGQLIRTDPGVPEHILPFRRIQFTPDMLPGDVLGVNVFEPKSGQFRFMHGPVFAHVVLADEINRAGPKVQSAFLECMAEKQVTIDNFTHKLDQLFFVIGTQNPLDIAGTYPLPLVQLDRFLLKIPMAYVDRPSEVQILEQHKEITDATQHISPVCTRSEILLARRITRDVFVSPAIRETIVDIVQSTRNNPLLQFGASTRAALMLQDAIKAWAMVNGRGHATEDDLKTMIPYVLSHRLRFHGGAGDPRIALQNLVEPHLEKLVAKL
jgi:MoxR-like ATPase